MTKKPRTTGATGKATRARKAAQGVPFDSCVEYCPIGGLRCFLSPRPAPGPNPSDDCIERCPARSYRPDRDGFSYGANEQQMPDHCHNPTQTCPIVTPTPSTKRRRLHRGGLWDSLESM